MLRAAPVPSIVTGAPAARLKRPVLWARSLITRTATMVKMELATPSRTVWVTLPRDRKFCALRWRLCGVCLDANIFASQSDAFSSRRPLKEGTFFLRREDNLRPGRFYLRVR